MLIQPACADRSHYCTRVKALDKCIESLCLRLAPLAPESQSQKRSANIEDMPETGEQQEDNQHNCVDDKQRILIRLA